MESEKDNITVESTTQNEDSDNSDRHHPFAVQVQVETGVFEVQVQVRSQDSSVKVHVQSEAAEVQVQVKPALLAPKSQEENEQAQTEVQREPVCLKNVPEFKIKGDNVTFLVVSEKNRVEEEINITYSQEHADIPEGRADTVDTKDTIAEQIQELLDRLHLKDRWEDKITSAEFLQIGPAMKHDLDIHERDLFSIYLHKLLMLDCRARYIQAKEEHIDEKQFKQENGNEERPNIHPLKNDPLKESTIHPLDVQMAVFHCSDSFLKQMMVTKLSQCQYALPLLVPDPFTKDIECPLWTFRQVKKTWKKTETKDNSNVVTMKSMPICKAETPMVFCFRLGSPSMSKSQLINTLINDRHSTFFHRNCPGSTKTRLLFDGVAEIAWYCPAGKPNDTFPDCVAFCNLHGDGLTYDKQLKILMDKSSVNLVFVPTLRKDYASAQVISALLESPKPLVLLEDNCSAAIKLKKGKYKVGLRDRAQSDVSEELKIIIREILSDPHKPFKLESVSDTGVRVDEHEHCCTQGFSAATEIMTTIQSVKVASIKSNLLPCQDKLLQEWCRINKEQYYLEGHVEKEKCKKQNELQKLREDQCKASCSELMESFMRHLSSLLPTQREYFLKWTQILIDIHATDSHSSFQQSYDQTQSEVLDLKKTSDKSKNLQSAACGLEHIFREMGQIYEAHKSLKKTPKDDQTDWSKYPELAAELMISGHPMELMDGDAGHVPLIWISSLIDQVIHKLGDKRVFVLTVLGIQGSGKSTMLNAMFGLQFAVSAGRCTKGAFMQLVKLSEDIRKDFKWDYILVVDTEGLRALELEGNATIHHDNELATFVVGVGNMTLVNIFGENPSEIQDVLQIVVQAFMRMKRVKLSPSCVFVHKNVTDVEAAEKDMNRKRKLQDTLDQMVEVAAKEVCDAESFSDIIEFDVQKDVKYFAQLWEGSPPMAPPNPGYSESVQDLKSFILSKASKSPGVTLSEFKTKVADLWNALLNENFVFSFKNTLEITLYRKLEIEFGNWTWALRSEMLNIEKQLQTRIENGTIDNVQHIYIYGQISRKYEEIKTLMLHYFDREEHRELLVQWKDQHELKIKDFCDEMVQRMQRNLSDFIDEKKRQKTLNEKRVMFEDKLLRKSKELSHQLKDKMEEEDLEKQFNRVWKINVLELEQHMKCTEKIDLEVDQVKVLQELGFESPLITTRINSNNHKNLSNLEDYSAYIEQNYSHVLKLIKQFIHVVEEEVVEVIRSKPVATKGYSTNYLREAAQSVSKDVEDFQTKWNCSLKKEFTVDLTLYVFVSTETWISESHSQFVKNESQKYLERKKSEHYTIFTSFCRVNSSAVVLSEVICERLKAFMTEAVCNRTAIDIAEDMREKHPAFNESRLNLEKHVLKSLAEKEDFNRYMTYIQSPKTYIEAYIKEEVHEYIQREKNVQILQNKNTEDIKKQVTQALFQATENVKEGEVEMWLQEFHSLLGENLHFHSVLSQNFSSVKVFSILRDAIEKRLVPIIEDLKKLPPEKMNEIRLQPDQILIDQLCDCCWETCPFCAAVCTNTVKDHSGKKHCVPFHRPTGIEGWHIRGTTEMVIDFCTTLVVSDQKFRPQSSSQKNVPYKQYQSAAGTYAEWFITPDGSKLVYWKWFICQFQRELEDYHKLKFVGRGEIPSDWMKFTKEEAIESLNEMYSI